LLAHVAEKGDKIDDPSIAGPDSGKTVERGELEIDKVDPDNDAARRALLFIENAPPASSQPTR
jgi:catalase